MPKEPHPSRRILVIDDSEVMLARIKKALVADGNIVTTTTQTIGNARHLAACELVIIDYHMPGIDGTSVQEQLRGAAAHLERPPLFYLYTSDPSLTARAKGFDGFFANKGDETALVQQVRAVFRLSQIRAVAERSRNSASTLGSARAPTSVRQQNAPPGPGEAPKVEGKKPSDR